MNILSFANLAVIADSRPKPIDIREKELKAISKKDVKHQLIFTAFLGYEGKLFQDYPGSLRHPVGYLYRGNIITSQQAIMEISEIFVPEDVENVFLFRQHLNHYYEFLDVYPPWHSPFYNKLVHKGATPRKLAGPHSPSGLASGEARWIVYDHNREIVFGPRV